MNYKEGIFVGYRWYEHKKIEPLYPFGYGLSYTTFDYADLKVSPEKFNESNEVTVNFDIKNTGVVEGMETAQLYVQDMESSLPRPLKELKGFKKINLKPGESSTVEIKLSKKDFLSGILQQKTGSPRKVSLLFTLVHRLRISN